METMRLLMVLALTLGGMTMLGNCAALSHELIGSTPNQKVKKLELSIVTDKHKYNRHDKLKILAMLTNVDYVKDLMVYGTLGWGHLSSLTYTIRDASGKRIQPQVLADELTPPIRRNEINSFVKLRPDQFIGVRYSEDLKRLNLSKPGRYSILVEYHCPISTTEVDLLEFWSKEDGILKSNLVWIEVIP
jgi:hypothetical protein